MLIHWSIHSKWTVPHDPEHLQGLNKKLSLSSVSSKQILQAFFYPSGVFSWWTYFITTLLGCSFSLLPLAVVTVSPTQTSLTKNSTLPSLIDCPGSKWNMKYIVCIPLVHRWDPFVFWRSSTFPLLSDYCCLTHQYLLFLS